MITPMPAAFNAIVLHDADNVATALHYLEKGTNARIKTSKGDLMITVNEPIGAGHKFSLLAIEIGVHVRKHGMFIGYATASIGPGAHVHTHNLAGRDPRERSIQYGITASVKGLTSSSPSE